MAKAYWIATYRSINDPEAVAAYAKIAGPGFVCATAAASTLPITAAPER